MDDGIEDVLRMSRDRLKAAMEDMETPANALPAISRQLIAICDRLEAMEGGDPLLDDDDGDVEVDDDVSEAIV